MATAWCALAAYVVAEFCREMAPIWALEKRGIYLCGPPNMNPLLAVPCSIAAVAAGFGRNRLAACFGLPAILAIAYAIWRAAAFDVALP